MFIIRASISGTSLVYGISPVVATIDMVNTYKVINSIAPTVGTDLVTLNYFNANLPSTSIPTRITSSTNNASSLQADFDRLKVVGTPIDMTSQQILNLFAANTPTGAVNLSQVQSLIGALTLSSVAGLSTSTINFNNQRGINCANPTVSGDIATMGWV